MYVYVKIYHFTYQKMFFLKNIAMLQSANTCENYDHMSDMYLQLDLTKEIYRHPSYLIQ